MIDIAWEQGFLTTYPLWARAYDDLGRDLLRERPDVMLENHQGAF